MIEINSLASGSSGNCYHITDSSSPLLLEAGIPLQKIREGIGFKTTDLAGCLITHEHGDHSKSVEGLMRIGVDCYMTNGTQEALDLSGHRIEKVKTPYKFEIGSWIGKPLEAEHDAEEPVNYLLWSRETKEKLVYLTDTFYTKYKFHEPNYIMIECNYAEYILNQNIRSGRVPAVQKKRLIRSHFSLANVKQFLRSNDLSQVREIWLLHLSDRNSDEERFKKEIQILTGKPVYVANQ